MSDYCAQSCQINNLEELKHQWCELQQRTDCSYFQSWGWIGTWLELIANELDPVLIKTWHNDLLVGMGIFVTRPITRHHLFQSNAVFLNEYPFDGRNMTIEYNGLLADKHHTEAAYRETIYHLLNTYKNSDEFFFGGLISDVDSKILQNIHADAQSNLKIIEQSLTWSVGLDRFNLSIDDFLKTLSKNRRAQIRRSIQIYEEHGPLVIEQASTESEAQLFFDGLNQLHTGRWKAKGGKGSFANPLWEKFHRALISSRFNQGEIQLLRVRNSSSTIAYLYNFIWRKHVYVLQTGFNMSDDKHLMPGYVAHVLAIVHNKKKGMAIYDLMHGDSLYKNILCDQSQTLQWLVIQRKRVKFYVEDYSRILIKLFKAKIELKN